MAETAGILAAALRTGGPDPLLRAPARTRRPVRPAAVLLVASLGAFMTFVDATVVNIAFPSIARSFPRASLSGLSWVLNAYNLVFAALLIAGGRLADITGRRRAFRVGVVVFALASGLCAAATSPATLVAARILQAAGAAVLVPASLGLVLSAWPSERRAHAVALWGAAAAAGVGLGPSIGGAIVDGSNWRIAFLINLPIGAATLALARARLVETRLPGRRALPDVPTTLLLAAAMTCVTLGLVQAPRWGWGDPRQLLAFALAAAAAAALVPRSRRAAVPVLDRELLRDRGVVAANVLTVVGAMGFFANLLCGVLFLTSVWGYSPLRAGAAMTISPLAAAATAGTWGRLAERRGYPAAVLPGAALYAAGMLLYVVLLHGHRAFLTAWLPAQLVSGIGAGGALPILNSAASSCAPGEGFAAAAATNASARQLGGVLGIAILVAILGDAAPRAALYHHGWLLPLGSFALVAAGAPLLRGLRAAPPAEGHDDRDRSPRNRPRGARRPAPQATRVRVGPPRRRQPGDAQLLAAVPAFGDLDAATLEHMAAHAARVAVPAGGWLFRQGDPGDRLYVVRTGRVELVDEDAGETAGEVGAGGVLGELSLLRGAPRALGARARRDSELLAVTHEQLSARCGGVGLALARAVAGHLTTASARRAPAGALPATVAVIGLGPSAPVSAVAELLATSCAGWRATALLEGGGTRAHAPYRYAEVLERAERSHDLVVLSAGCAAPGDSWSAACLRQADAVVVVAGGGGPPLLPAETAERLAGCHLLLWEDGTVPQAWRAALAPASATAFAGQSSMESAVQRLARRLCGTSLGLVLSGGGARAFAHIGVLEELLAAGLRVDRVGGVSMGAVIGAMFAAGMCPEEIDARCDEGWARRNPLTDFTLPRHGLIHGAKVRAWLSDAFGDTRIEDLARDFFCVSCDLASMEQVVHRSGPVDTALSASMCIPGLAPAIERDGRWLVDGGLRNNLPVDVMAADGPGPIVAVDVTARMPGLTAVPRLGDTLFRLALGASADTERLAEEHGALRIAPDGAGVGLLEFHQLDRMREAGRQAARDALHALSSTGAGHRGRGAARPDLVEVM